MLIFITQCVNNMKKYDYLIVGSGLFGSTFAYKAMQQGKKCLVIDKRLHLGGIFIVKRLKVLMFISMVLIFSILLTGMFGIL